MRHALFIPAYSGSKWNIFSKLNDAEISRHIMKKDFKEKKSLRVFRPGANAYFNYKYILIPTSENYRQEDFRKQIGAEKSYVMVDSGGYQLATGTINHKRFTNEIALAWSEENGDCFPILDRPTAFIGTDGCPFKHFDECYELSLDAANYYSKNRKKKNKKILNVMQGRNKREIEKWFKGISQFQFEGWAIGGSFHTQDVVKHILSRFNLLWKNGELDKKKCEILHIFGVSSMDVSIYLEYIQRWCNKINLDIQIQYDASTWNRTLVHGGYFTDTPNFSGLKKNYKKNNPFNQQILHFTNKNIYENMDKTATLPCDCPICIDCINVKNFFNWDKVGNGSGTKVRFERFNNIFSFHNL